MKENVLVALADQKFLTQAKQLFSTVYWNSGWDGDYLLLAHETQESELQWFREKNIIIKHCQQLDCGSEKIGDIITASKCYLFSEYFKQWNHIIYLDVDILTRGSLLELTKQKGFAACFSIGQTIRDNFVAENKIPIELFREISHLIKLDKKAFNSGVMSIDTSIIDSQTFQNVLNVFIKFVHYGLFGGDQLPFNIYFYNQWQELPSAYNQIIPLSNHAYNPKKLPGIVIHCVLFGKGPWDPQSVFYKEWQDNLNKADKIDLSSIPKIHLYSKNEIKQKSDSVLYIDMLGGTISIKTITKWCIKIISNLFLNPKILITKFKILLK